MSQRFECGKCGKMTRFKKRQSRLKNRVVHTYAQCEYCKAKATICYTDPKVREMLKKQRSTKGEMEKKSLAESITVAMNLLKNEYE
ncbi:hypothetical protein ACWN8V_07610 [Vagococcus elongatus]|uniref:Uncharacterized protein n=1 Tax=Vagococcus elongatus TaxID=180344 RepID=A0A430AU48_9ENTE|nr:hypothetical protein [Vagococcus elongatus]RSU11576.1 hypothetical protein CBF29_07800 [Vagococcus elongatus]